ncbi:hypothetical protein HN587_05400 [Candidatus Woesearchaeota archaeon]|jgi:hypothetical protein|nr:hypothetical protein [Candidatus Woesearchaeota archaeon]
MASFLDIGLINYFGVILPILLVFVLLFGVLQKTKIFGDSKGLQSIIAFCIALMLIIVPGVVEVINIMAPWFVLMFIFFFMIIVSLKFMGVNDDSITTYMSKDWETAHWFILAVGLIIFIGAISAVYGGSLLPFSEEENVTGVQGEDLTVDTGNFNSNVGALIFHPKVIGMVFILILGSFTIRLLAGKSS